VVIQWYNQREVPIDWIFQQSAFMNAGTTAMHEAEQGSIIFWKGAIMKTRTSVKGGRLAANNSQVLKVRTGVKGGRLAVNHSEKLKVRTGVKGGRLAVNHSEKIAVRRR
jgi:hypothetical protein